MGKEIKDIVSGKTIKVECETCFDEEGSHACVRPSHGHSAPGQRRESRMSDKLQAREWFINGGAGHEDGADGLRASMWSSEAVIEALDDYREYLLGAALTTTASDDAFYAAYANHCAIQGKPLMTAISWRKAGKPNAPSAALPKSIPDALRLNTDDEHWIQTIESCPYNHGLCLGVIRKLLAAPSSPIEVVQPASASLNRERLLVAIKAEVNKEYRQLDGWARQSDVEAAIDRALAAQPGVRERELSIEQVKSCLPATSTTQSDAEWWKLVTSKLNALLRSKESA